jgi:hypothetical protein
LQIEACALSTEPLLLAAAPARMMIMVDGWDDYGRLAVDGDGV